MTTPNSTLNLANGTNLKLFVFFALLLLSSTGSFAQANTNSVVVTTSTEVSASDDAKIVITNDKAYTSSAMEFAVWFMGTKKTNNDTPTNGTFSKKQLINSGINTNSVLIRSLLKKVSTQEKGIA
jgi:hypothetical protein